MANLPAICNRCGAAFRSAIAIESGTRNVTISSVSQNCPYCGNDADVFEGTFTVAGDVIEVVRSNQLTVEMLAQLGELAKQARERSQTAETFAKEAEEIHPALGPLIRQSANKLSLSALLLMLIALAVKSCSLEISLDANKLIDQMSTQTPESIMQDFDKLNDETKAEQ